MSGDSISHQCTLFGVARTVSHVHALLEQRNNIRENKAKQTKWSSYRIQVKWCHVAGFLCNSLLQKYNKILESLPANWAFDPPGPSKSPSISLGDKCNVENVTIGVWRTWGQGHLAQALGWDRARGHREGAVLLGIKHKVR